MRNKSSLSGLTSLAALAVLSCSLMVAAEDEPKDFNQVLSLARQLESAKYALQKPSNNYQSERINDIYRFVKATKSSVCDRKYDETLKRASEYKIKAYELVSESKKTNKNWFSNVVGNTFGPISKLRGMSKSDVYLNDLTKRYEGLSKSGLLSEQIIECDINRFKIKTLHEIMLILQAEVKYVITGPIVAINRAIYDRLKADQYVSTSNFYDTIELSEEQRKILLDFLSTHKDLSVVTVGQAEDHYYNPGQFVIGRLLETCQILSQYNNRLASNSKENSQVCAESSLDPLGNHFAAEFKPDRFDSISGFCNQLLEAL